MVKVFNNKRKKFIKERLNELYMMSKEFENEQAEEKKDGQP